MIKKIISIDGMHCMHCASGVEKAISALDGAKSAKVNLGKKCCSAKFTDNISDDIIISAVKEAGFEVIGIETKKVLF